MNHTDEQLITEFYAGQESCFDAIFDRYKRKIFNFCLRILDNRADAEDVTSEVFWMMYDKKGSYQEKSKFSTWIFTVARNACLTKIRKQKPMFSLWFKSEDEDKQWEVPDTADLTDVSLMKEETKLQVLEAIAKLKQDQKEALVLREFHGFSYTEIADVLDCSLEKVKILIYRARVNLKAILPNILEGATDGE